MDILQQQFIQQNSKLVIDFHPSDKSFLIIRHCTFDKGSELCKKYKASGSNVGKSSQDFAIGDFGKYN